MCQHLFSPWKWHRRAQKTLGITDTAHFLPLHETETMPVFVEVVSHSYSGKASVTADHDLLLSKCGPPFISAQMSKYSSGIVMLLICLSAHQNRVSAVIFCLEAEWVISTGHDKCVSWMCTRSGNMLGRHYFTSWASCLQYPSKHLYHVGCGLFFS